MKQSFVRMMNCIAEMENCLLRGLVLDEHGNWVSIAERKAVEADSLAHLSAGQVLFEGRWVTFTEVKSSRSRRVEIPPLLGRTFSPQKTAAERPAPTAPAPAVQPPPVAGAPPGITIIVQSPPVSVSPAAAPQDTAVIVPSPPQEKEPRTVTKPPPPPEKKETATAPGVPPETALIIEESPPASEKEAGSGEFAPETKIILIMPPEQSVPPSASDTQTLVPEPDTRLFHMPNIPRPEETRPAPKNRTALIIGTMVVVATLAAVILIVLQMIR
jgi:hypothetical protein